MNHRFHRPRADSAFPNVESGFIYSIKEELLKKAFIFSEIMKRILFILFFIPLLFSCDKDATVPQTKLTYVIDDINGNELGVSYYSDYYEASGILKEISINDTSVSFLINYWEADRRYVEKDDTYYIKVEYKKYYNPALKIQKIYVYANDTSLIDSFEGTATNNIVELQGTVPEL